MFARKVSGNVIITRDKTEESERDTITTMFNVGFFVRPAWLSTADPAM